MSPLVAHRRSRRRSWSGKTVVLVCGLVVVALLVGGITQIGRQSGPFDASVNRSFAVQGAIVVGQSNATAVSVRHLMQTMQNKDRRPLQAELDALSAQAEQEAARSSALVVSSSSGDVQGRFAAVFADRAEAVNEVRAAVDGLLGLHPFPVAGAPGSGALPVTPTLLSSTVATDRIAGAGRLLSRADTEYRAVRASLATLPGHARLPASKWVTSANAWQLGAVATQVDLVAASSSLAATHQLVIRAVRLSPPALPPPGGVATPTVSALAPTTRVTLSVVLSNLGSVDEPHASVQFTLAPQPTGAARTMTRTAPLAAAASVTLAPVSFAVRPGHNYTLTVAVIVPPGQTDVTGAALTETLQIAPN
jgi:hypothetical protein